jgi:metallo-beta-lactamase family protein
LNVTLTFHGAAGCVTGSCARLAIEKGPTLLVDCGLFQGPKTLKALNYDAFPFDVADVDAVLLTHAHVDHSGLLPKLMLAGYKGPIFATAGTRALCAVMLPDAGAIQEMEVEQLNRRNRRRGLAEVSPIYTARDATDVMALFRAVQRKEWITVTPGVRARWWNAGHILGSSSIEVEIEGVEDDGAPLRLLFSGDVGPGARDFADDPEGPAGVDHLILESTYGAIERTERGREARRAALAAEMKAAHAAGGPLVIPAFAVERTQELLADLIDLMEEVEAPPGPIFLDSPLAIKATDIFLTHAYHDMGRNPFAKLRESRLLRFTESAEESRAIERFRGWHIIMAASGMCDAGRIRHHLKRLLWKPEASILLVGFQAVGTLGRLLQEGRSEVRIEGEPYQVRARIRTLEHYSGHADGPALTRWAEARRPISGNVFLVHGEPPNRQGLRDRLRASGFPAETILEPEIDRAYRLRRAAAGEAPGARAARIDADAVSRLDWHNARAEFMTRLELRLREANSDKARMAIIADLGTALGAKDEGARVQGDGART